MGSKRAILSKFLAFLVSLCFERRCRKQNTVARLKSTIYPLQICGLAYWLCHRVSGTRRDKHPKKLEAVNAGLPWKVFIASQGQ